MIRILAISTLILASPAQADQYCDDLWFARNLAFHQAGYCFGSALGQAVFGNDGCTGKNVQVASWNKTLVDQVFAAEAREGCKTDTSRTNLDVQGIDLRKRVVEVPMPTLGESSCLGYQGPNLRLYTAADENSGGVGALVAGDEALFAYEPRGEYEFVIVRQNGAARQMGWVKTGLSQMPCKNYAG